MMEFMETNWAADSTISDGGMTELVNATFGTSISDTTVWRCRTKLKFAYRPPKVVQDLTSDQKDLRVSFCQWVLANTESLQHVIFTDESRFQRGPDNRWRRIKRGVYNDTCFVTSQKFPQSLMVWGGIGLDYRSPLVKCSNSVDADEYIDILSRSGVIEAMNSAHGQGKWFLLQDGAPCHTSQKVADFLHR